MKCINPITIVNKKFKEEGNKNIDERESTKKYIEVPCGKCINCRNTKSTEWGMRIQHEADNYNIVNEITITTLTYNKDNLDYRYSLKKKDVQDFMKRLRVNRERAGYKNKIKYFIAGEYGTRKKRPHYHALLYGVNPLDEKEKELINKSWGKGYVYPEMIKQGNSAAMYVAKYINKGDNMELYHDKKEYEKYMNKEAQFKICSSGLGKNYVKENRNNLKENLFIPNGKNKKSIPKQYIKWLKDDMNEEELIKFTKKMELEKHKKIDNEIKEINEQYKNEGAKSEELDFQYIQAQIRRGTFNPDEIINMKKNQLYKNIVKRKTEQSMKDTLDKIKISSINRNDVSDSMLELNELKDINKNKD